MLATTPLLHLHGSLAGYADIWVMGTSGMGLTGLCIWSQRQDRELLAVSFLLFGFGLPVEVRGLDVARTWNGGLFFMHLAAQRFGSDFGLASPWPSPRFGHCSPSISAGGVPGA